MKYATQYLTNALRFIDEYDGSVPLHHFLKNKFAAEKKYGSKDRKHISHLCYCYFRLGHFIKNVSADERIKISLILSGDKHWNDLLSNDQSVLLDKSLQERIAFIEAQYQQSISSIFPWQQQLSEGMDKEAFKLSHLQQPNLFIRVRPNAESAVKNKLDKAGLAYEQITNSCFAFENATRLENVIELNKEYVVQDRSSQQVGELMSTINRQAASVWDCCAASGGKAIMAYDLLPKIDLTVSDVRQSIIHNLKERFQQANIKTYHSFIADLTRQVPTVPHAPFDFIICDAPCSGSGTWSRTPEQLYFFKEESITYYSNLQKKIVSNVIPFIKEGGHLLYITCSVFRKENEEVVTYIKEQLYLTLVKVELLKGYDKKADTMFAALFTTSSL